jgi:hypothetical protein
MKTIYRSIAVANEVKAMTPTRVKTDNSIAIVIIITASVFGVITSAVTIFGVTIN